jgi:hypothetical protein
MRPLSSEILQTVALLFLYALGINWSSQDCDTVHIANEKSASPSQTTNSKFRGLLDRQVGRAYRP